MNAHGGRAIERLRRAFAEFLTIPSLVVFGFLALAIGAYYIDAHAGPRQDWGPVWRTLDRYVGNSETATSLLATIAGSLITVTSITFSILLLAIQQGAAALTNQIFDQYLRRSENQAYFGLFVGASIYALVTLVLTNEGHRPVIGATLAVIFAGAALCALVLLIYSTIDQTRPVSIIATIHDAALTARSRQNEWLARTAPRGDAMEGFAITSQTNGYAAAVHVDRLERLLTDHAGWTIEIRVSLGDPVLCGQTLSVLVAPEQPDDETVRRIRGALPIEEQRDLGRDPAYSIDQLNIIAWTSTSTAKSNPGAALIACRALHDLLWRWSGSGELLPRRDENARIFYRDTLAEQLLDTFESLIVVASESMQHQTLAALVLSLDTSFSNMPPALKDRVEAVMLGSLAVLGDHAPTRLLGERLNSIGDTLASDGRRIAADRIAAAWAELAGASGTLHSRGTRA